MTASRTTPPSDGSGHPEPKAGAVVTVLVWLAALVVASFLLL